MVRNKLPPLPLPPELWVRIARDLKFSPRQKEIVELILRNQCDKQIVLATGLEHPTVRTYLNRIFQRTAVSDRYELLTLIMRMSHDLHDEACHP